MKKNTEYSQSYRKNKRHTDIWWDKKLFAEIKAMADQAQEPMTVWIRRAVRAQLRREKLPKQTSWPTCSICGKKHDSNEHYGDQT